MDRPQLENGYTRIANEILETIPTIGLNGTQYGILLVVFRYTYGFQRKEYQLSLTFLAEAINSHKVVVQREVNKLIKQNILIEISAPTFNKSRIIAFNKDYKKWVLTKQLTANQKVDHTVNQLVASPVNQLVNQERKKENIKENIVDDVLKLYKNKLPTLSQPIKMTDKRKSTIKARVKEYSINEIEQVFDLVASSPFLMGMNERKWQANMDWILNPNNFVKILEEKYSTKELNVTKYNKGSEEFI